MNQFLNFGFAQLLVWGKCNNFQPKDDLYKFTCHISDFSLNIIIGRDSKWDSPMKRWLAYKRGRKLWGGSRKTLSWTPSGSAKRGKEVLTHKRMAISGSMQSKDDQLKYKAMLIIWSAPLDSCIPQCWSPYCNKLSQKAPTWTWHTFY